jgi:hypothetical protein
MSKSPLSGAFAGSSEPAKKNKKNGALLLISGIALATSIGGVFAANTITINSNADIEFGQGTAAVSSCEAALDVSLTQAWNNTDSLFYVDDVVVSGIAADCNGLTLVVKLLDSAGATIDDFEILGDGSITSVSTDLLSEEHDPGTVERITVTTEN